MMSINQKAVNKDSWRRFRKNPLALGGGLIICFLIFLALFADVLSNNQPLVMKYHGEVYFPVFRTYLVKTGVLSWPSDLLNVDFKKLDYDWAVFPPIPYTATNIDLAHPLMPPSVQHWLGTDEIGRDVLAGIIHGSRYSLSVGLVAVGIYILIGLILGALAGYYGGWTDLAISRMTELVLTFPTFFLIITVIAFLPPSIFIIMVAIGMTGWPEVARFTRGEFLKLRQMDYIHATKALGFGDGRTIFYHLLPNALAPIIVIAVFGVAGAILVESSLSFLGFGVPATTVTWGSILSHARGNTFAWWLAVFPGLAIFTTVTAYNLVGEGLRDTLDPRLKD